MKRTWVRPLKARSVVLSWCFHSEKCKSAKVFVGHFHSAFTVKCKRRDVFTCYTPCTIFIFHIGVQTYISQKPY